jgi:hypothetical protein
MKVDGGSFSTGEKILASQESCWRIESWSPGGSEQLLENVVLDIAG